MRNVARLRCFLFLAVVLISLGGQLLVSPAQAQSYGADLGFLSLPVETVTIEIANPRSDKAYNDKMTDGLRKYLAVYPGDYINPQAADFAIAKARRSPDIDNISYSYALGRSGGLDVTFTITLAEKGSGFKGRGCVGAVTSPTRSELGAMSSTIGKRGSPVSR